MINEIIHGDCLEVMKQIPAGSVDMILCDLPYGTTQNKWDSIIPLQALWEEYKRIIKLNGAIVLTAAQPFTSQLVMSCPELFKYDITWDKAAITGFLNADKMPLRKHEDILVFYKNQPTYNPQKTNGDACYIKKRSHKTSNYGDQTDNETYNDGQRFPTSILPIPQLREKGGHPTQKPVRLFSWLVNTYTNQGDTVLDNCIGSGTTAIACYETGRNFIGIEKDKEIFNMAKCRTVEHQRQLVLF